MKKSLLRFIPFTVCIGILWLIPSVYAQTSNTGEAIIPPPNSETIQPPQIENLEVIPITPQTSAMPQTPQAIQPLQPLENTLQPSGTTPTIQEQSITPIPQGAIPGIPMTTTTGELQTSPITPSLQPLQELAPMPAPETPITPAPAPEVVSPAPPEQPQLPAITQTPPPTVKPAAQLPITPSTTTEAITATPTSIISPAPQTAIPQVQTQQPAMQLPTEEHPKILVTKPPQIVPGEVLTSMPVYVNTQTTHTVKPGEDLHWLAAIYYGDARLWYKIYDANKSVIKNPNNLVVGTKLIIPAK